MHGHMTILQGHVTHCRDHMTMLYKSHDLIIPITVVLALSIVEYARSKFARVSFTVARAEDASLGRGVRSVKRDVRLVKVTSTDVSI